MKKIYCNKLAKVITKAGVILLENGAETSRVEDTMSRICYAYGANVVDTYVTPTLLIVSFSMDDELQHNIKRIQSRNTNLSKVSAVNELSRNIVNNPIDLDELSKKLDDIDQLVSYRYFELLFGATVCVFGFSYFFGGNFIDAIFAMLIGTITYALQLQLDKISFSSFFKYTICGATLTALAILASTLNLCNRDVIIISAIMLLVPGLAITNAIKDTVNGDLVSGMARAVEAIFIAIAIAVGSGLIFMIVGWF